MTNILDSTCSHYRYMLLAVLESVDLSCGLTVMKLQDREVILKFHHNIHIAGEHSGSGDWDFKRNMEISCLYTQILVLPCSLTANGCATVHVPKD